MYEYLLSLPPAKAIELDFHDTQTESAVWFGGWAQQLAGRWYRYRLCSVLHADCLLPLRYAAAAAAAVATNQ